MSSLVEIYNLALGNVGTASVVSDPQEQSAEAAACRLYYPISLQSVLRAHDWNFARTTLSLARVADPLVRWRFAYAYPDRCLAVRRVLPLGADYTDQGVEWELGLNVDADDNETRVLLCNQDQAVGLFTRYVKSPNVFDPLFVSSLGYTLGSFLAVNLTENDKAYEKCEKGRIATLHAAYAADAREGRVNRPRVSEALKARL